MILFVVAPSSGKTTTQRIITGEELPDNGDAYVCGHSVTGHQVEARQRMGYCPQVRGRPDVQAALQIQAAKGVRVYDRGWGPLGSDLTCLVPATHPWWGVHQAGWPGSTHACMGCGAQASALFAAFYTWGVYFIGFSCTPAV